MIDYPAKKTTTYTYDSSGRLVYEYKLLQYSDNTNTYRKFTYLYDESGIVGVVYNNNGEERTYHYNRNIKGDVIGIFDVNGAKIVKYSYDSWGNFEITTGSLTNIAKDNPILYRGYYYDHDTELYLLDSRFYNPKWRRFISPDDIAYLDPDTPNGLNLYAYCNNDPVNFSDPSGHSLLSALLIIGATTVLGAVGGYFVAKYGTDKDGNELSVQDKVNYVIACAALGMILGGIIVFASSIGFSIIKQRVLSKIVYEGLYLTQYAALGMASMSIGTIFLNASLNSSFELVEWMSPYNPQQPIIR